MCKTKLKSAKCHFFPVKLNDESVKKTCLFFNTNKIRGTYHNNMLNN